jgi:hypothetical protein
MAFIDLSADSAFNRTFCSEGRTCLLKSATNIRFGASPNSLVIEAYQETEEFCRGLSSACTLLGMALARRTVRTHFDFKEE